MLCSGGVYYLHTMKVRARAGILSFCRKLSPFPSASLCVSFSFCLAPTIQRSQVGVVLQSSPSAGHSSVQHFSGPHSSTNPKP